MVYHPPQCIVFYMDFIATGNLTIKNKAFYPCGALPLEALFCTNVDAVTLGKIYGYL